MRQQISNADLPAHIGVYIVFETGDAIRPLYVGKAATQSIAKRWMRQHLKPRAGGSALRRSLGLHLGLATKKLRLPDRFYPAAIEEAISAFLHKCWIEFVACSDAGETTKMEAEQITALNPILNVKQR